MIWDTSAPVEALSGTPPPKWRHNLGHLRPSGGINWDTSAQVEALLGTPPPKWRHEKGHLHPSGGIHEEIWETPALVGAGLGRNETCDI